MTALATFGEIAKASLENERHVVALLCVNDAASYPAASEPGLWSMNFMVGARRSSFRQR